MAPDKLTILIYPGGMSFEMLERHKPSPALTLAACSEYSKTLEIVEDFTNHCGPCGAPVLKRGQICKHCARKRGWR